MSENTYLGIDAGTQGLSVVLVDDDLSVLAVGEGDYGMLPDLEAGQYEQLPADWEKALQSALDQLRANPPVAEKLKRIAAIGISGQMHGEVLIGNQGQSLASARLWCDSRNEDEGDELTQLFGVKVPKRMTIARWLWSVRNRENVAEQVSRLTTPAGWLAFCLTGKNTIGIGDASGMFPLDWAENAYQQDLVQKFENLYQGKFGLAHLLPKICTAGQDAGTLTAEASDSFGLPKSILVAPAEGDQPAALAGSFISEPGMVSVSFGTSVCANSIGDRDFQGVCAAIDHFGSVDGKPINMVFLRNGTTFMNSTANMFVESGKCDFGELMVAASQVGPSCEDLIALPFIDDEPGLNVSTGSNAGFFGLNASNTKAPVFVRAALNSTIFNLKHGMDLLTEQGFPRDEIILTGGLTKTPEFGQVVADVLRTPVVIPVSSDEGTALGAALLAKYRDKVAHGGQQTWSEFVKSHRTGEVNRFEPNAASFANYEGLYNSYFNLIDQLVR